jgi:hypothetical protein
MRKLHPDRFLQFLEAPMRKIIGIASVAATLALLALGGWGSSTMFSSRAASVEASTRAESAEANSVLTTKQKLVGSYDVTGTDADGARYSGSHIVDISLAPSGALELDWDNGKQVGVAHVLDDALGVATISKGRTVILIMTINPDGSLSGKWSRRTDRGPHGGETWTPRRTPVGIR